MTTDNLTGEEFGDAYEEEQSKHEKKKQSKCCCCLPLCARCPTCCPCSHKAAKFQEEKVEIDSSYKPNRWPQDVCCVMLFALLWCGMVVIAVFATWSGNPLTLIKPTDYQDNMCGYAKGEGNQNLYDLSTKPYLWYPFSFDKDITQSLFIDALDLGICVEKCPTVALTVNFTQALQTGSLDSSIQTDMIICNYPYDSETTQEKIYRVTNKTGCFLNIFPTTSFTSRCIPNLANATETFLTSSLASKFKTLINSYMMIGNVMRAGVGELQSAWFPLVANCIFSLIICFVLILLIRLLLKLLIYTSLFMVLVTLCILTAYTSYIAYSRYQNSKVYNSDGTRALDQDGEPAVDEANRRFSYVLMGLAGFFAILTVIYIFVLFVMIFRIGKALSIIGVASKVVFKNPQLLIVPPIMFAALIGVTAYWLVIAGYIESATIPVTLTAEDLSKLPVSSLPISSNSSYTVRKDSIAINLMQYYHLFGYFWTAAFLSALGYCTISGVIAQWYFSAKGDTKKAERLSVVRSLLRSIIFHCGSILFGSLIVAIVQILRVLLKQFEKFLNRIGAKKNPIVKVLVNIGHVILTVLYYLVKFFNKNAYIVMMIHGTSFLTSGARAFFLVLNNILVVGTVTVMGQIVMFFLQIMITIIGGIFTYFMIWILDDVLKARFLIANEIQYSAVPTLAGAFISFCVAGMFVNLYSTSIDTILICYCEDKRMDPKEYPYTPSELRSASDKLKSILTKKKKDENNEKELKEQPTGDEKK